MTSPSAPPEHATLEDAIPEKGFPGSSRGEFDAVLEAFIDWHEERGLSLYAHQEEAILELYSGSHVILATPTGSGKSMVARAVHFLALATGRRSWFTAPIKALVSEKFFKLCEVFGADNVGLMTGDGTVNADAPIICCTAEVLAQVALGEWEETWADFVVMDEFHYYGDRDRGMAWQLPLLLLPQSRFLLMSATLGDTRTIEDDLEARTGRAVSVVKGGPRPVPLDWEYVETPLHETVERLVRGGRAPVYLVHFTQAECVTSAQAFLSLNLADKDEKKAVKEELGGVRFDTPFGKVLRRFLESGIGVHHAGLLPRYRLAVERLAQKGLLRVIVGTDTLGVGINVPIRTVLFSQLCKYDGEKVDLLSVRDFRQIAGRAGRAGFDTVGYVRVQAPAHVIENARLEAKAAEAKKKKRFVRKKPPQFGYRHWDRDIYERMRKAPPEALEPVMRITHGMMLVLMQRAQTLADHGQDVPFGGGYRMALEVIDRSHLSRREKDEARLGARRSLRDLERGGVLRRAEPSAGARCGALKVEGELQRDFSLHTARGLWLVEALDDLDAESEEYALDVIALVEAIQDQPRAVLRSLERAIKGRMIGEMKAQGIPYEERMERLEDVSYPKPKAEWIYTHFNAWCELHPWVDSESIAPKGVVRTMLENWAGFVETVNEYGLARMEGVFLRYLSGVWRTLSHTVPAAAKNDGVVEIEEWLRALIVRADSSLLMAWEELQAGGEEVKVQRNEKVDISADPKAFRGRLRAEVQLLVRALSLGDWEEAAVLASPEEDGWSADEVEAALAPYEARFGHLPRFDHHARQARNTSVEKTGPHQWRVEQVLGDDEDSREFSLRFTVDLRADTNPSGRIVQLVEVMEQ
jgi:hypothetical protein